MQKPVNALRVLVKAFVLFVVFNLLFAWLNPPIGRLTAYNSLWPGRVRFPYSESPNFYALDYNAPVIQDFDAMFGAHILSAAPKSTDEYRIFLLGDSATWGGHVLPEDMLAAIMRFTGIPSLTGLPALSVPCGFDADGMPIGMQIMGPHLSEETLLRIGHMYQNQTDWHRKHPPCWND